jgi:hypothetical protein
VLDAGPAVFALRRERDATQILIALTNVTDRPVRVRLPMPAGDPHGVWRDVLSRARYQVQDHVLSVALPPYGVAWLSSV